MMTERATSSKFRSEAQPVCTLSPSSASEYLESILLTILRPPVVVSGKVMFDLLPAEYKSLAVRMRVKYMPHPYIAIGTAKSRPTGLGMESDGLEVPFEDLPPWEEKHVKIFPVCWKNPVTGNLHVQVHPSGIHELVRRPHRSPSTVTRDEPQ